MSKHKKKCKCFGNQCCDICTKWNSKVKDKMNITNPKKRLEEILVALYQKGSLDGLEGKCLSEKPVAKAISRILKEFVHKDNLPSREDIMEKMDYYIFARNTEEKRAKIHVCAIIHKLIEGD